MEYLLLIYDSEEKWKAMPEAESSKLFQAYGAFTESIIASGHFKAGQALQSVSTATTVRLEDGKAVTTDGPFAETREQLGGFYWITAKDLDEAIAIAARIPSAT